MDGGWRVLVDSVAFSPDGRTIASASGDNIIQLWDVDTGELLRRLKGHKDWVFRVAYSPDGDTLASGGGRNINLWDADRGEHLQTLEGHTSGIRSVVYSPEGGTIASGGWDGTIRLWDTYR